MRRTSSRGDEILAANARSWRSLKWWPALLGTGLAALVTQDMSRGSELAPLLAISALVYLGAATLQKPALAWAVLIAGLGFATVAGELTGVNTHWTLLLLASLVLFGGLLRHTARPLPGFSAQAAAMAVLGLVGSLALLLNGMLGAGLVAAGLLAHAGWDLYHHRADKTVARSFAEFCFIFDTLLALAIIAAMMAS